MIDDNHVSIMFLYFMFIDYYTWVIFSWHSMLELLKYNKNLAYNEHQEKPPTTILSLIVSSNISVTTIYNEVIGNIQCWFIFKPWVLVYKNKTRKYYQHLC